MRRLSPIMPLLLFCAACSMRGEINDSAASWQGHQLMQVEAAWGAPSTATTIERWTSWREGNGQGGWIVRFHTDEHGRIDKHDVTTWGALPPDIVPGIAPGS